MGEENTPNQAKADCTTARVLKQPTDPQTWEAEPTHMLSGWHNME